MRSTRLAATLLLALLFGWAVRSFRKGQTSPLPAPTPAAVSPAVEPQKNTFPNE